MRREQTEREETSLSHGGSRGQRQSHMRVEVSNNETQRLIENQTTGSWRIFLCTDRIRFISERIGCQPETFVFGVYFFIFITMVYIIINKGKLRIKVKSTLLLCRLDFHIHVDFDIQVLNSVWTQLKHLEMKIRLQKRTQV